MISAMDVLSERGAAAEYLALHPRAWNLGVFVSCAAFSFIAAKLISKTKKKNIMYILFPVSIFIVLAVMQSAAWVSGIFFNFAVSGTISGLMLSITPTVFQAKQLLVTVKRDELTSEEFFENCEEVTVRALHARLVDALSVSADLLKIESGKGGFIEDLDNASLHDAIHAVRGTPEVERAVCYIAVLDGNDGVAALDPGEKRVSRTSIVSLLTNKLPMPPKLTMRAEVRLGMDVYMIGKMPNAADDASSFSVSSVQTYAAATTNSSAKHIALRFLPWNNPGSNHSNDVDDATSFGGMSHGASDKGPVRCGDSVVIECDGK